MTRKLAICLLIGSACATQAAAGQAPVYRLIYSPPLNTPLGYFENILEERPGLFAVLSGWQSNTFGATIFSVTSGGTVTTIYGLQPSTNSSGIVQGTNGVLYGDAFIFYESASQSEYFYSVSASGKGFKEYPFPGTYPNEWGTMNTVLAAPPGQVYDSVGKGPGSGNVFAIAELQQSGKLGILHQFAGSDGAPTGGNLVYGVDGNIYGIGNQQFGGINPGFIFRISPSGSYSQLVSFPQAFPSTGYWPVLVAGSDGNLYAAFSTGGTNNTGQLFRATLSGQLQSIASFPAKGMIQPVKMMQAADGNLYGSTNSDSIFRYDLATSQLSNISQFSRGGAGQPACPCPLVEGMDGKLYGVSADGGNYPGVGTVFSLDIGLPKPLPVVSGIYPSAGKVGQQVVLWGNWLLGVKSVSFNGAFAAAPISTSVQSVLVTVPSGATSGPVTVTTGNGSVTTTQSFTVQ